MFIFLTFCSKHKEARYLFCIFPPFIYFITGGVSFLRALIPKVKMSPVLRVAGLFIIIGVIVGPMRLALAELRRFEDPVYSQDFLRRMSAETDSREVRWSGIYNIYPRDHNIFPNDEFMYFHHINSIGATFWLGRPVKTEAPREGGVLIEAGSQLYSAVNLGEVPEPPKPLFLVFSERAGVRRTVTLAYR